MAEQTPCPRCGYVEGKSVAPMSNHMNEYVDEKTGKSYGVLNSNDDKVTVGTQSLVKKALYKAPTPVVPPKK